MNVLARRTSNSYLCQSHHHGINTHLSRSVRGFVQPINRNHPSIRTMSSRRPLSGKHQHHLAATRRLAQLSHQVSASSVTPQSISFPSSSSSSFSTYTPRSAARVTQNTPSELQQKQAMTSQQAPHPTLLIPGPIEFADDVLQAMSTPSESHVGMPFVNCFGDVLAMLRKLFITSDPASQPLVLSGSGTLGWDVVAANLVEPGDEVLVLHSGYFGDSFADCLSTYGAKPNQLRGPIGSRASLAEIETALKAKSYKAITITHTDTSTGVLSDPRTISELVHRVSPETLVIVDGVCSVGCEEIQFDEWGLDCVLTASQKAIGVPAGLMILMCSKRAMEVYKNRKTPPGSYFASFKNWIPIMQNYEAKKPSYFATPSPQLIRALHCSLTGILAHPLSQRFEQHKAASKKIKSAVAALGLKQLASNPDYQANGMTAIYLPEGITPPDILPILAKKGVVFAGGLHREIATKYIRIGSMGVSVTNPETGHVDKAINALKEGLVEVGYQLP